MKCCDDKELRKRKEKPRTKEYEYVKKRNNELKEKEKPNILYMYGIISGKIYPSFMLFLRKAIKNRCALFNNYTTATSNTQLIPGRAGKLVRITCTVSEKIPWERLVLKRATRKSLMLRKCEDLRPGLVGINARGSVAVRTLSLIHI